MGTLVSVIMPVYNVRPYLERAVHSLLAQTFFDFELLLSDDGSDDGSAALCDEFAAADSRVRVLHGENAGAPVARNRAMETAAGRYFYFMDADDWAEPDMLERLVAAAEAHEAELVVAGFSIDTVTAPGKVFRQVMEAGPEAFFQREEFRRAAARLFDSNLLYPPWNKLFRADYILQKGIRFPKTFWDDFPFNLLVIRDIDRVALLPAAGYHFMRERPESETARYRPGMYEKREEEHGWMLELYDYWGIQDAASREMIARRHAERAVGCIENLCGPDSPVTGRKRRKKVREMMQAPRLRESLRLARPRSVMMRCLLLPLKLRLPRTAVAMGKCISFVKRKYPGRFARLKAGR